MWNIIICSLSAGMLAVLGAVIVVVNADNRKKELEKQIASLKEELYKERMSAWLPKDNDWKVLYTKISTKKGA